jgi:hypothetical protein
MLTLTLRIAPEEIKICEHATLVSRALWYESMLRNRNLPVPH